MTDHAYKQKRALLAQFWKDQSHGYGKQWTQEGDVKSERFAYWLDSVADYTTEQIRDGILAARKRTEKFPPNVGEFLAYIKANIRRHEPQDVIDVDRAMVEQQATKLLAGKVSKGRHRIIKRGDDYAHQTLKGDEWSDAKWQEGYAKQLESGVSDYRTHWQLVAKFTRTQRQRAN